MNLQITPSRLEGEIAVPASKSIMHRALICAALSPGISKIENAYLSKDISATIDCLSALGASFSFEENSIAVTGMNASPEKAIFPCRESGSTIRFMIPIAAALGIDSVFTGEGRLKTRPLNVYQSAFLQKGVDFSYSGTLPARLSGKLLPGNYVIAGNISSQFITGLLFALPLLDGDSSIEVLPPFESKSYVDITLSVLSAFGIKISQKDNFYFIQGNQSYQSCNYLVESDYSQAAFFLTANCLGSDLTLSSFSEHSVQGDSFILRLLEKIGVSSSLKQGRLSTFVSQKRGFQIDASDIPDLVPILCVLACFCEEPSAICRVERLRIKESDRIQSTIDLITALGGQITYENDCLTITPCEKFHGGQIDCHNDHRIAMSAAVAALKSDSPVILIGAECVEKSYPTFFEEYQRLGGICHVVHLE